MHYSSSEVRKSYDRGYLRFVSTGTCCLHHLFVGLCCRHSHGTHEGMLVEKVSLEVSVNCGSCEQQYKRKTRENIIAANKEILR